LIASIFKKTVLHSGRFFCITAPPGKIQSKRVDFVVCDIKTNRYCVIELDDRSHIGKQGKDLERDGFFDSAGIHSLRYKINNKPSAEALREDIFSNLS